MFFSVIVPVYKVEKYLKQCVDSVLAQTYFDFELILVDDGSPDSSPAICDDYAKQDNRVKVIHKENGGSTSARKVGVAMAKCEYILFIDGDDFIDADLLLKMKNIISKYSCDIVCFGYDTFPDKTRKAEISNYGAGIYDRELIENEIFPSLVTGEDGVRFPPSIWGKVFRRELLTPVQMDLPDNIIIGEDSCVSYATLYQADSLYVLHDELYRYRVENASLTRGRKSFSWAEPLLRMDFYLKYLPEEQFGTQIARITAHSLFNVAVSVLKTKDYGEAKKIIKRELSDERVRLVLKKAKFKKNRKEKLALYCLRHKNCFLMKIISKVI